MGVGPTAAIPKLLGKFNLTKSDIDLFEINEAFASMAVYCLDTLGLDPEKVNARGGAIALGHPLGATGARQICTILSEARRTKKRVLVTSMCVSCHEGPCHQVKFVAYTNIYLGCYGAGNGSGICQRAAMRHSKSKKMFISS